MSQRLNPTAQQFVELRPNGGFPTILADVPWPWETRSEKGQEKSPQKHYDLMSIADLCALPVPILAADHCALFFWATWPTMPHWNKMIEAWGFAFSGLAWEWCKFNPTTGKFAFGPGYGTRKNLEPCLLATRGDPQLRNALPDDLFGIGNVPEGVRSVRDWIEWWPDDEIRAPRREHSRKPDEQYHRIETLFPGPYIELFSRSRHPGWAVWGNQVGKFSELPA